MLSSLLRSALVVIYKCFKARRSGRESVARVGRNPGYMDVFEITIPGTGYPLPGGYDGLLEHLCITMSAPHGNAARDVLHQLYFTFYLEP